MLRVTKYINIIKHQSPAVTRYITTAYCRCNSAKAENITEHFHYILQGLAQVEDLLCLKCDHHGNQSTRQRQADAKNPFFQALYAVCRSAFIMYTYVT